MTMYDLLGARHDGGRHRHLSVAEAPSSTRRTCAGQGLRGGLVYHDGMEDDARFALAVARTAARGGARSR